MEVKTEEITVTTRTYTLKLTEAELTAALVDAKPLQRELRKARNGDKHTPNWATAGYAGNKPRSAKAKPGKSASAELIDCPHGCGVSIKPRGLKMHERKCPRYQLRKVATAAQAEV